MSKRILALLIAVMMFVVIMAGCGNKDSSDVKMEMAAAASGEANFTGDTKSQALNDQYREAETAPGEEPKTSDSQLTENGMAIVRSGSNTEIVSNAILAQRKIIRNANISVEVDDFDKSYGQIKSMIITYGFIQESNVKKQKDYEGNPITSGVIVIRVDKDKFDEVLTGIKGLGALIDESIRSDDVTDKYFDIESRLRLLRFEEGRLEEYLKKINDPDTIFKTESRLTDIRHEIESLTGTLKKWNDLVALSTITINLYEKSANADNIPVVKSYSNRLVESFSKSIKGVAKFLGELLIFLVAVFPVLLVLGVAAWLGFVVYRKFARRKIRNLKATSNDDEGI